MNLQILEGIKVVYVGDSKDALTFLTQKLSTLKCDVITFSNSIEALDYLKKLKSPPGIIIVDYMMPGLNGADFVTEVRSVNGYVHVPILILTAHNNEALFIKAIRAGADAFVSKDNIKEVICAQLMSLVRNAAVLNLKNAPISEKERNLLDQLLEVKNRLSIAISAVNFGVWDWNLKTGELIWDDHMYALFGVKKSEFNGAYDAFEKTLVKEDAERVNAELQATFKLIKSDFQSDFRVNSSNGTVKQIKAIAKCFYDSESKIDRLVGVNCDISTEVKDRASLVSMAKLASLGEMAGGIAHEINNPLAIIQGKAGQIKKYIAAGVLDAGKINEDLTKIELTSQRISKIIKGLRSFSRNGENDPMRNENLSTIIQDVLELCKERFKHHSIDLTLDCPQEVFIECRGTQIAQVMMNLLGNACDAIDVISEKWIKIQVTVLESKVLIKVTDSGIGIPREVAEKVMEPFFTTKDIGKGTGLGLSISQGIVVDHQGKISYDFNCKNTCFVIELPLLQSKTIKER